MRLYKLITFAFLLLLLNFFSACKKVINVDINSTSPIDVVEGNVTNLPGPYLIALTKTVNFSQNNTFPPVSGAVVVINDITAGQADTLAEATPGNYYTHIISGVPGHTYQMYINAAGSIFKAACTMPQPVQLDSLYTQAAIFGKGRSLVPVYTDPVATGNYYDFQIVRNDTASTDVNTRNDALINGQVVKLPLRGGDVIAGDSATVTLECIDSAMYQYFYGLSQTENQNSASPANPPGNITGGALGYFSAHTVSAKSILAQ